MTVIKQYNSTTSQWETVLVGEQGPAGSSAPTGAVMTFAGAISPTGWLLCFGQEVSRTTYADLFAVCGTIYGAGNGTTTFNLPDLRGRVAAGKDDMGGSAASRLTAAGAGITGTTLGASGGFQTHKLVTSEIPAHTHAYTLPVTTNSGSPSNPGAYFNSNTFYTNSGSGFTAHSGGATTNTGSDVHHNNTQPTIVLNYIIKV